MLNEAFKNAKGNTQSVIINVAFIQIEFFTASIYGKEKGRQDQTPDGPLKFQMTRGSVGLR